MKPQIVYKKLTESELDTFINMRITQLTEEYTVEGKSVPEGVDLEIVKIKLKGKTCQKK